MKIKSNSNFHQAGKTSVFDIRKDDAAFAEYRRRWSEEPPNFVTGKFPIHLDIESTNACNLKCPFCATTTSHWGPSNAGMMDMSLYRSIIDEGVANGLCAIKLSLRGEPLLNKNIAEMVSYAKQKGVLDVYFNTNGMMLTEEVSAKLIDAGLDRISISFEGTTKEVYEKNRPGAVYETVIANAEGLIKVRNEKGVNHPQVRVQTVMLPEFEETFNDYKAFWEEKVDEVAYLDARDEGPEFDHRGKQAEWACPFLWQRMTILWDGTLLPCLMHGVDDFSLMSFGNVNDLSIADCWNGDREAEIRRLHKSGKSHQLDACDRCSYRAMESAKPLG